MVCQKTDINSYWNQYDRLF